MNLLFNVGRIYVPQFIRRKVLREIFNATAVSFGVQVPSIDLLNADGILSKYAAFTAAKGEEAIRLGSETEVARRLYENASEIGRKARRDFGVKNMKHAMTLSKIVYGILGIEFYGTAAGEILIRRCYFSRFYSSHVCRLISAFDVGFLAGVSGSSNLRFINRITEGDPCCRAHLAIEADT